jgi:hypothetical protein
MSAKLYVKRGGAGSAYTDVTRMTGRKGAPFFDGETSLIQMGMRYADGESCQGNFVLVDPEAEIHSTTYRLPPHGVVLWTEDASGDELWLARNRVAPLQSGRRGVYIAANEIEWEVETVDCNIDLTGNPFPTGWSRPAETDIERLIALQAFCLNGTSSTMALKRSTTTITVDTDGNGHLLNDTTTRNLKAHIYPAGTFARDVIADIAERSGKTYGVTYHDVGGESHLCLLYIGVLDNATYTSPVKISQVIADHDPDDPSAPVVEPKWDRGKGTLTENSEVSDYLVSLWGGTDANPQVVIGQQDDETDYERWGDTIFDPDSEDEDEAQNRVDQLLTARRAPGHRTHQLSIKLHADQIHLVRNGMSIQIKSAVVTPAPIAYVWRRITEVKVEPVPDGDYWAHIDLDKPLKGRGTRRGDSQPAATSPKPAPEEVPDTPGTVYATFDFEEHGFDPNSFDTTGTWDSNLLVENNPAKCPNGAAFCGYITASHRSSDMIGPLSADSDYILSGDVLWTENPLVRKIGMGWNGGGAMDAVLVDGVGYAEDTTYHFSKTFHLPATFTEAQICFSPYGGIKVDNLVLSGVATAAVNDPDAVNYGTCPHDSTHFLPSDWVVCMMADLQDQINTGPDAVTQTVTNNSGAALTAGDVVVPDITIDGPAVTTTTTASSTAGPIGIALEDAADDAQLSVLWYGAVDFGKTNGTPVHGDYLFTSTTAGAANTSATRAAGAFGRIIRDDGAGETLHCLIWGVPDAADAGTIITDHGDLTGLADNDHPQYRLVTGNPGSTINVVSAAGSTETLDASLYAIHDVTLTADCTLTLAGATAGVECSMAVLLRQGSGAPWEVTWPGSVEWVGGVAPTLETAEDAWNWVTLTTLDGGTVWFGDGGGATDIVAALDDLTDVTITTPAEGDRLRYTGGAWLNSTLHWVPLTTVLSGDPYLVWDDDNNLVMTEASA